jgi:hypothetical protein
MIWGDHLMSQRSARLAIPHVVKRHYGLLDMWLDIPAWALIEKLSWTQCAWFEVKLLRLY